ncbi:MAG: cardiolipin synthase [Verrucomicrobiales bacterium]|jgi:cardiolipin synthase|nr:cardiolipin synthase [Verrucomicrobiales bacterium]
MEIHWHWIASFLLAVIQLTGWVLIPKALFIARTPQAAVGWSLALLFLPVFAIPLFLVFGESRFSGYTKAGDGGNAGLDAMLVRAWSSMSAARGGFSEKYADAALLVEKLRGLPVTGGNSARLLVNGTATFDAIFAAIDAARHSVLVQFFIISDDQLGNRLKDRLIAAAGRGVKIYVLYDSVGSKQITLPYLEALRRAGVRIQGFVTNRQLGMNFQINFRNHRKLVLADHEAAFLGGLNAADEYLTGGAKFDSWRDTHMELRGPAVSALRVNFAEDWFYATEELIDDGLPIDNWPAAGVADRPRPNNQSSIFHHQSLPAVVFASGPADRCNGCLSVFATVIQAAKRRLWLASPYFVPDSVLRQALTQAALRGVDTRVLLPSRPDHLLPWWSAFSYYPAMRDAGVKIYRYLPGFMHQKVLLADDDLALVGSVNADYRSLMLNFELTAAVNDRAFAADVHQMLERDFASARAENMNLFDEADWWFRLRVKLAQLSSMEQ